MTLEEFRRIILTPDSEYVKYFDEHIVLYEVLKGRFEENSISIEMTSTKKYVIYTIIPNFDMDPTYLMQCLNDMNVSFFNYNFNITTALKDGMLTIKLMKY